MVIGEWNIACSPSASIRCEKNTPVPSGARMEYATLTPDSDAAIEAAGRVHPVRLRSSESTTIGACQLFPASADDEASRSAVLSARTLHQTAWTCPPRDVVRRDAAQPCASAGPY